MSPRTARFGALIAAGLMLAALTPAVATARWRQVSEVGFDDITVCRDGIRLLVGSEPFTPRTDPVPARGQNITFAPLFTNPPQGPPVEEPIPRPDPAFVVYGDPRRLPTTFDPYDPPDDDSGLVWAYTARYELLWSRPVPAGAENLGADIVPESAADTFVRLDVSPCLLNRTLDIRPSSASNRINPTALRPVRVALKTSSFLDATTVPNANVRFGPGRARSLFAKTFDVDADGDRDRVFFFIPRQARIPCGATKTFLRARTTTGHLYDLSDSVTTVGC